MKRMKDTLKEQNGFTLIELVIVLAIIGLLIGIAIPVYIHVLSSAEVRADNSTQSMVENAVQMVKAETGKLPAVDGENGEACFNALIKKLNADGYLKQETLTVNQEGKHFEYDPRSGKVSILP